MKDVVFHTGAVMMAAAIATAQGFVVPSDYTASPATGATNVPFGRSGSTRAQFGYGAGLFTGAVELRGIAFRSDEGVAVAAKAAELEIRLSTMPYRAAAMLAEFAQNRGADETVVVARKAVALPAAPAATPGLFALDVPFDRAFRYDPAGGTLVVEVVVYSAAPGAYPLDLVAATTSRTERYGPPGCGGGGRVLDTALLTTQVATGKAMVVEVRDAEPGAPTTLMFGLRESGVFLGVPIPFDLTPLGAPGCHLAVDPLVVAGTPADALGAARYSAWVPPMPQLQGAWVRFQAAALEPAANALGAVTSQPHKVEVRGPAPVARVYASGSVSTVGLREIGTAPVLRLR